MKNSKLLLSVVVLGAGVALVLQQHLAALALVSLAVFVLAADGSFEEVPRRERGCPMPSVERIRRYREEHPGVSVAQAVERVEGR